MPASPTDEPLLRPEERRLTLFPVRHPDLFDRYKQALASFWTAGEVDLSHDPADWKRLTADERHFVSHVLAFFASADGIVNDNLAERFCVDVQVREAKLFYDLQKTMENIHSEMYSLLIETLVDDAAERDRLFHAVEHVPCVRKKAAWAQRWIDSSDSFAARLVAFAVVEGIFFSASFCAIFWLKQRGILRASVRATCSSPATRACTSASPLTFTAATSCTSCPSPSCTRSWETPSTTRSSLCATPCPWRSST